MAQDDIRGVPSNFRRWLYYHGPKGIGAYTTVADANGWYYSFFCKPSGKGARTGEATTFTYVPRTLSKRKRRKAADARSFNLSQGKPVTTGIKAKPKTNLGSGVGYCMKDKKRVIMNDLRQVQAKNGRAMVQGECPDCGLLIHKYGKIAICPQCDSMQEMAASDYICKECREHQGS